MKKIFTLILYFTTVLAVNAQIATYDMSTIPAGVITASVPASSSNPNVVASDIVRGAGLTPETGIRSINSLGWSITAARETGKFYEFTITPAATNNLAITGITFDAQKSPGGPATVEIVTRNGAEPEISRGTIIPTTSNKSFTVAFTYNTNGAPLTFRIYGYSAVDGSGSFRLSNSLTVNGTAPFPVTLISFKASTLGQEVNLNWNTTDALNFSHFSVERSNDARSFEAIGRVDALKATSSEETTYHFTDETPRFGLNYYRLKQTDIDGSSEYSKTVSVNMTESSPVVVYPNPVSSILRLKNTEKDGIRFYRLYDATGRVVREMTTDSSEMSVQDLPTGIYNLQLVDSRQTLINRKFIKQ